jgi:hypothetical protein
VRLTSISYTLSSTEHSANLRSPRSKDVTKQVQKRIAQQISSWKDLSASGLHCYSEISDIILRETRLECKEEPRHGERSHQKMVVDLPKIMRSLELEIYSTSGNTKAFRKGSAGHAPIITIEAYNLVKLLQGEEFNFEFSLTSLIVGLNSLAATKRIFFQGNGSVHFEQSLLVCVKTVTPKLVEHPVLLRDATWHMDNLPHYLMSRLPFLRKEFELYQTWRKKSGQHQKINARADTLEAEALAHLSKAESLRREASVIRQEADATYERITATMLFPK